MAKQSKNELVVVPNGFDYSPLAARDAEKLKNAAERIRQKVKRTIEDIIEVGQELLSVKESMEHGQFGLWLKAEFGWTERTARNFMAVAERFGAKTEIIFDLGIAPTAAYLLAAPSAPDEAREKAIERAESGEQITTSIAKEILASARKKTPARRSKRTLEEKLAARLQRTLERYRDCWNPKALSDLAQKLRDFADELEKPHRGGHKPEKAKKNPDSE